MTLDTEIPTLSPEILSPTTEESKNSKNKKKEKIKKEKVKKEKKKKEKSNKKGNTENQTPEIESPRKGATPERNLDRTGKFISEWVGKILSQQELPKNHAEILQDLFRLQNSRNYFIEYLETHSRNTKGSITDLETIYFDQFVKICTIFLKSAEACNDLKVILSFIEIMGCFREVGDTSEKFLFTSFKELPLWEDDKLLDEYFRYEIDRSNGSLNQNDFVFSILARISCNIMKLSISYDFLKAFLSRKIEENNLSDGNKTELFQLIDNMHQIRNYVPNNVNNNKNHADSNNIVISIQDTSTVTPNSPVKDQNNENSLTPNNISPICSPIHSPRSPRSQRSILKVKDKSNDIFNEFECKETLNGHKKKGGVSALDINYPLVVSGTITGHIKLYDLETQNYSSINFNVHKKRINSIYIDNDVIISASQDNVSFIFYFSCKISHPLHLCLDM